VYIQDYVIDFIICFCKKGDIRLEISIFWLVFIAVSLDAIELSVFMMVEDDSSILSILFKN